MNGTGYINVYWKPTQYAVSYELQRWNDKLSVPAWETLSAAIESDSTTQVSYADKKDMLCGVPFYYRIRAKNRLAEYGPWGAEFEGMLSPWAYDTPLLYFSSASNTDTPAQTTFSWNDATQANVTGYRIFQAEVSIVNGAWTYGKYNLLVDTSKTPAYGKVFTEADHGKIFSYIVAAKDDSGGLGPKSRPFDVLAGRFHTIPLAVDPEYGLSSMNSSGAMAANIYGQVYHNGSITYTFDMPANTYTTPLFVYLQHYNLLNLYDAQLAISYLRDGTTPISETHPVNESCYSLDGYQVFSTVATTVTLTVSVPAGGVNYYVWIAEKPTLRPW